MFVTQHSKAGFIDEKVLKLQIAAFLTDLSPKHVDSLAEKIDYVCRFVFPAAYLVFVVCYAVYYTEAASLYDISHDEHTHM